MSNFEKYIELSKQIKVLEDTKKNLGLEVMDEMLKSNEKFVGNEEARITMAYRGVWKYTEKVKEAEEKVKKIKKLEEESLPARL